MLIVYVCLLYDGLVTCLYSVKFVRKPTYYNYFTRRRLHGTRPANKKRKKNRKLQKNEVTKSMNKLADVTSAETETNR